MIDRLLKLDPQQRIALEDLQQHAWIQVHKSAAAAAAASAPAAAAAAVPAPAPVPAAGAGRAVVVVGQSTAGRAATETE